MNRWQDLKVKKDKLKDVKRSLISTNINFLRHEEQYKIENVKLSAKLVEARRAVNLQNKT